MNDDLFFPDAVRDTTLKNRLVGRRKLADEYIVPPFSVFDARSGPWKKRKRSWLALGIKSELGRGASLLTGGDHNVYGGLSEWAGVRSAKVSPGGSLMPAMKTRRDGKTQRGDGAGRPLAQSFTCGGPNNLRKRYGNNKAEEGTGTSIFDPVLCEIMYRWFCPAGGRILDPFAGGSVRGIVASVLGYRYTGIDLSEAQLESNREQAKLIVPDNMPRWIAGDSLRIHHLIKKRKTYNFLFTCPPYFDLEKYSMDDRDLSNMTYGVFLRLFYKIIDRATKLLLRPNSFACIVVGDVRDKKTGFYRNLVGHTVMAFEKAGCPLYNEAILLTAVGSLPLRARIVFGSNRKLGKTHQQVLIFCKGDPKKAAAKVKGDAPSKTD
jgi:hypothetical protein